MVGVTDGWASLTILSLIFPFLPYVHLTLWLGPYLSLEPPSGSRLYMGSLHKGSVYLTAVLPAPVGHSGLSS